MARSFHNGTEAVGGPARRFRLDRSDVNLILDTARCMGLKVVAAEPRTAKDSVIQVNSEDSPICSIRGDDPTRSPFCFRMAGNEVAIERTCSGPAENQNHSSADSMEPHAGEQATPSASEVLVKILAHLERQAQGELERAVNHAVSHARQWDLESESLFLNLNRVIHAVFAPDYLEMQLQHISEYWPGRSDDAYWADPPQLGNVRTKAFANHSLRLTYRRDQVVLTEDPEAVELDPPEPEVSPRRFETCLSIPLIWRGTRLGILRLYFKRAVQPLHYEVEVLEHFRREFSFILDRTRIHLQTLRMAATDGLTGLFNHRFYREQLRTEFRRAKRYQKMMSLIMIDIDDFKSYNDSYGHLAGDRVLVEVARTIRGAVRDIDFVARYGGEEFALVLPEVNAESGMIVAEKIRQAIEKQRFQLDDGEPIGAITVSCGVTDNSRAETAEELMEQADQALYWVKRHGRNLVRLANGSRHES